MIYILYIKKIVMSLKSYFFLEKNHNEFEVIDIEIDAAFFS